MSSQLPSWLCPNSNALPQFYKKVWHAVRDDKSSAKSSLQREVLVDTNKIFPLLLTSQLSTDTLGYIWSLANKKYAGQLTEQELYVVLALVALAQTSYPFNSLQVLHFINVPPVPSLNASLINQNLAECGFQLSAQGNMKTHNSQFDPVSMQTNIESQYHNENSEIKIINKYGNHKLPSSKGKINDTSSFCADSEDEFSEFQSAPISYVSNMSILDSKHGSAIGSRLANHNLGSTHIYNKSKKINVIKHQKYPHHMSNFGIPSTIRDSMREESFSELFPKCNVKNQSKLTVILKDTLIRNDETLKIDHENIMSVKNRILEKDDDFGNFVSADSSFDEVENLKKFNTTQHDLMNLQPVEDKYSALRALVDEPGDHTSKPESLIINDSTVNMNPTHESLSGDEFGDFVSAEHFENQTLKTDSINIDLLSNFEFNSYENTDKSDPSLMQEISEAFDALGLESGTINNYCLSIDNFDNIHEADKISVKDMVKEDTLFESSVDVLNNELENLPRSASVLSLDLKSFLISSQEDDHPIENMHQLIYSEWKLYMESCAQLLQLAANVFTNITSKHILQEVLASAHGYNFLCNLSEVAAVCRRVNFSYKEMNINIMGFDELLLEIDRIWAAMEPYYSNIPIISELPIWPSNTNNSTCALCLTVINSDGVVYNDNNYHLTCANLWLNCVNDNLPALKCPLNQ